MRTMNALTAWAVLLGASIAVSSCLDSKVAKGPKPTNQELALSVGPANQRLPEGKTLQLQAHKVLSGGTYVDATAAATWESSDESIATIDSAGVATAVTKGICTIKATVGEFEDETFLFVIPKLIELQITPIATSFALRTTQQFVASGIYSDYSLGELTDEATWSFPDLKEDGSAEVAAGGLASGLAAGSTILAAAYDGLFVTTPVTVVDAALVSIEVAAEHADPDFVAGVSEHQLTAVGTFDDVSSDLVFSQDLTTQVTWMSSDTDVAEVSKEGLLSAGDEGSAIITALLLGEEGSMAVAVEDANLDSIDISPESPSVARGWTLQLRAVGNYDNGAEVDLTSKVTWSIVEDEANPDREYRAEVDGRGTLVGIETGSEKVKAEIVLDDEELADEVSVTVTSATLQSIALEPDSTSILEGETAQFVLTGTFSDSTTRDLTATATWLSTLRDVADISNLGATRGRAKGIKAGSTTIQAWFTHDDATFLEQEAHLDVID